MLLKMCSWSALVFCVCTVACGDAEAPQNSGGGAGGIAGTAASGVAGNATAGVGASGVAGNGTAGVGACPVASMGCPCGPGDVCDVMLSCQANVCVDSPAGAAEPINYFLDMDDPNRNMIAPGGLCERLTTIQCAGEALCCSQPGRDYDTCKAVMLKGCKEDLVLDAISLDPRAGFDAEHAAQALEAFEGLAASCNPAVASWGVSRLGLAGMMNGSIEADGDCSPPNPVTPTVQGAAISLVSCRVDSGQACLQPDPLVLRTDWRCVPRAAAGGLCFSDLNCQDDLYCDNPGLERLSAACRPRGTDGAPCATANECLSITCLGGTCVSTDVQAAYCLAPQ